MAVSSATQQFVPVREVRNGIVILKDDGYRGVLMCSSVNFSLKSEDEQRAIVGGFQSFLNTLDFSVEILVHSRKMDIRPYLSLLQDRAGKQQSELMRIQIREYMQFIQGFMENVDVMTKLFYVVVPYTPAGTAQIASALPFSTKRSAQTDSFEEDKVQLQQRMALVEAGLESSGIRAVPLGTEEVIELLYRSFNIGALESPIRL